MNDLTTLHRGQNRRVLVVADDTVIPDTLLGVQADERPGPANEPSASPGSGVRFEVTTAAGCDEALQLAAAATAEGRPFALAFVGRCSADGLDILTTVERLWSVFHDMEVVVCTAVANRAWEREVQQLGWTDRLLVLKTPLDPVEVRHIACALTHSWNLQRQALSMLDRLNERVRVRTSELERTSEQLVKANCELSQAKLAAESANRAKTMFLANISHELRTPITAILGYAEVMQDELGTTETDETARAGLETICRNASHLVEIVGDLLDIAKLEAGKLTTEQLRFEPARVIEDVVGFLRPRAARKGLAIEIGLTTPIPVSINSDPLRLRQIFVNLIENAIKFSSHGTIRVALAVQADEPRLVATIADEGCGMTAEVQRRLFRPFEQADTSTTRQFGGTGLGLALSRQFAQLMGGDLTVRSQPGRGCCFTLTIATGPLDGIASVSTLQPATPTARPRRRAPTSTATEGLRVLLAEDGVDNQRLITAMLERAGIRVTLAENGEQCVQRVLQNAPEFDLILMDMQMPVMDGLTATARLREAGIELPIVALTANAMASDRRSCLQAGCDDFLTKPIDRAALIETMAQLGNRAREAPTSRAG